MISANRPLKAVVYKRPHWDSPNYYGCDAFDLYTKETIDVEDYYPDDTDKVIRIVESCSATWFEHDGAYIEYSDGSSYKSKVEVRCMEPAVYCVYIPYAGGGGDYCEFHKPKIRGM